MPTTRVMGRKDRTISFRRPRRHPRANAVNRRMSDAPKSPPANQIQIDLDEAMAQGTYCNLVLINHSDSEFVLDFAFLQPAAPQARVRARILSSPRHTKRLLRALESNLQRYEERFGKIEEPLNLEVPGLVS
jgi:hypothetical protein